MTSNVDRSPCALHMYKGPPLFWVLCRNLNPQTFCVSSAHFARSSCSHTHSGLLLMQSIIPGSLVPRLTCAIVAVFHNYFTRLGSAYVASLPTQGCNYWHVLLIVLNRCIKQWVKKSTLHTRTRLYSASNWIGSWFLWWGGYRWHWTTSSYSFIKNSNGKWCIKQPSPTENEVEQIWTTNLHYIIHPDSACEGQYGYV